MTIQNLNSWADTIELVRLPAIESELSTLRSRQNTANTLLLSKVQEFTDAFATHSARIDASQSSANNARTEADRALSRIYFGDMELRAYIDMKIQLLRDQLGGSLAGLKGYVDGEFLDTVGGEIAARTGALQGLVNESVAAVEAIHRELSTDLEDIRSVADEMLDQVLPAQGEKLDRYDAALNDVQSEINKVLAGFDYESLLDGVLDAQARAADIMAPLGVSIPRAPASAWTVSPDSNVLSSKVPINPSWLIRDPILGDCARLPLGGSTALGQSYPVDFDPNRVYRVRARVRVLDPGTQGGVHLSLGVSTWVGQASLELNREKVVTAQPLSEWDGDEIFTCLFSANEAKLRDLGHTIGTQASDAAIHLSGSATANQAFFHVRQNFSGLTNGQLLVGMLEVKDITEALDAAKIVRTQLEARLGEGTSAAIDEIRLVLTDLENAIALARSELTSQIEQATASLGTNYYTIAQADQAIAGAVSGLKSALEAPTGSIGQLTATLTNEYYTKTQTDLAISTINTNLSSRIDNLSGTIGDVQANLTTNYMTGTQTNQAISSATSSLSSSITTAQTTADGKGKVLYQSTAPAVADRLPQNLWVDTTNGANTPKRWNGTAWVAVTDKVATDAAAAAASAQSSVNTLSATLTNDYYTKAGTDSAMAARISNYDASVSGGIAAKVASHETAIASLDGHARAMVGFKVQAGNQVSLLDLVAYNGTAAEGGSYSLAKLSADQILLEGSVSADYIQSGKMNARFLEVTELLSLDTENAGFALGKRSILDEADGVYMGGTGESGFGLAASRTVGSIRQSLALDPVSGFVLRNARHRVTGATLPQTVTVTTSQTITLPVGTRSLSLILLGGGGGGASGSWSSDGISKGVGGDGGPTIVQLYDGETLINTYTASGGLGGSESMSGDYGGKGESSNYGTGGKGATPSANAKAGSGYGAGGGGGCGYAKGRGGAGGRAGKNLNRQLDISSLSNPKLIISIGNGGAGGVPKGTSLTNVRGAAGSSGQVKYTYSMDAEIIADVVPLQPTAVGSFDKESGATGTAVFPDLGPGLWVLDAANSTLVIGTIEIDNQGTLIHANSALNVTFFASKRPNVVKGVGTARTIRYAFYSMGNWG